MMTPHECEELEPGQIVRWNAGSDIIVAIVIVKLTPVASRLKCMVVWVNNDNAWWFKVGEGVEFDTTSIYNLELIS